MRKYISPIVAGLGLVTSFASTASAHIRLLSPEARYDVQGETGIKSCPCGLGGSNRVCNVAQDGSDDDRSARVTRLEAGSTLTLRFEEFVDHAGRFRVAFDPDGADMADFNANVLDDISDPRGTGGQIWEMQVTLPNVTCDNCTLQLVQAMEVDVDTPVADPAPISSYYACVDLQLVAPGTLGEAPGAEPDAPGAQPPEAEPGAEQPGAEPPDEGEPGDDTGDMQAGQASDPGGCANAANEAPGTPLIPAGGGTPMDTGASGSVAPSGEVAMNGGVASGAPGSIGSTLPPPPSIGSSSTESDASGGCGLGRGAPAGAALGAGLLGLLAVVGLGRRARRGAR